MKIQTFSIVTGSEACDAKCPYCVSRMTPSQGLTIKELEVNWRNFHIAAKLAERGEVTTAMLTGKGEPTLCPEQITGYLERLQRTNIPLIELQTNGLRLGSNNEKYDNFMRQWYDLGLTTIAISVVHYENEKNAEIYTPGREYMDLSGLVKKLHNIGFSVRLGVTMVKGYIDDVAGVENMVSFAGRNDVEQLTFRPVTRPQESKNLEVYTWTTEHLVSEEDQKKIRDHIGIRGKKLLELSHGATVYDVQGQNVCVTNCLTRTTDPERIRQIIFFPDGHVGYDWEYKGAILF